MRKGFTLMELIVVVIIIGILAMIGLPQFFKVAERGRAAEGVGALGTLRNAQLRYALTNSSNQTTSAMSDLDVDVSNLKYFTTITLYTVANPQSSASSVADILRSGGYTLSIAGNGNITCTAGGTIACPPVGQQ